MLLGHKCSCTQGTRKDQRKEQNTLGWFMASLISKGTYLLGLTWATERWVDLHPHWPNLQSSYRGLQWIQSYISSRWSQQYLLSQGCVPEAAPSIRTMGRTYIPKTENRVRSLQVPGFNSQNNQRSCLLSDHLQYPWRKEKWEGGGKRWISSNICSSEERKKVKLLSRVKLFETPWTVAHQAPPSMGFSRQEYWSGLPFPSPGHLPDPGIKPRYPALWADVLPSELPGNPAFLRGSSHQVEIPTQRHIFPGTTQYKLHMYKERDAI